MEMTKQLDEAKQQSTCRCRGDALAISARELAAMLNVSLRQVWRLSAAGKLPKPLRIGGSVRWNRQEILNWFDVGCPDRQTWDARRAVQR